MLKEGNVINQLRNEVRIKEAFNAVAHVFAVRQRARHQVTLTALLRTMRREGFNHPVEAYTGVLEKLAALGFGRVEKDAKGHVRALKDVRVTLQSIGSAACGTASSLSSRKLRTRYRQLAPRPAVLAPKVERPAIGLSVVVHSGGKQLTIPVPAGLTLADMAGLLEELRSKGAA